MTTTRTRIKLSGRGELGAAVIHDGVQIGWKQRPGLRRQLGALETADGQFSGPACSSDA